MQPDHVRCAIVKMAPDRFADLVIKFIQVVRFRGDRSMLDAGHGRAICSNMWIVQNYQTVSQ